MPIRKVNRCKMIWHYVAYTFTWVFLWGYYLFAAPTTFRLLSDTGQEPWLLSMIPKYTLFFGLIASLVALYVGNKNDKKIECGAGGNTSKSVAVISLAYIIPLMICVGEMSLIVQTSIAIPFLSQLRK
jgi:hypothetical protein